MRKKPEFIKKKSRHIGKYDTPEKFGEKWQMDVKYVPIACYAGKDGEKFYKYTMIDEAYRERFIFPYKEQSGFSTVDFIRGRSPVSDMLPRCFKRITVRNLKISAERIGYIS